MSSEEKPKSFAEAGEKQTGSLLGEVFAMIRDNKKWWMIPIIAMLTVFGALLILGSTGAAPFIYALF